MVKKILDGEVHVETELDLWNNINKFQFIV